MAVTPKRPRGTSVGGAATLSASEALKAAEAALGTPPAKTPAKVPAKTGSMVRKPTLKPIADVAPVAVMAASTAVDAAPEPAPEEPGSAADVTPVPAVVETPATPAPAPVSKTAAATAPILPEGTTMMNDMIETGKKFAEETKAKMETVYADLNEKAKASVEKSTKAIEEFSDIAKGNVEALVESGKIAAKGMETLGQEAVDFSRKSFEKATASAKSFSTAKTPTEFFQLQSAFISSSFDDFAKEAAKHSEAFIKLAGDIAAPMTARVSLVTDKVKSLAA